MKRKRIVFLVAAVLAAAIAFSGCGKDNGSGGAQTAASSAGSAITSVNIYTLELDGKSVEVEAKTGGREVRAALNALTASKATQSPEDEESSIYVEWIAEDDSYYAFVYQMADGTSLVEMSAANADAPKFYEGKTTFADLEAIVAATPAL